MSALFGVAYDSQQECERRRWLRGARTIRLKLGGSTSLADPFPYKPKGMHWKTYRKLLNKGLSYETWFFGELARRFP